MAIPTLIGNLAMSVGEDKVFLDQIFQSDGVTQQNITGWTANFVVHEYGNPNNVFILKSTVNGITRVDTSPLQGFPWALSTVVANADTVGMAPGEYEYYYERVDTGNDAVVTKGCFTLERK